jgi:hypothetical protein
LCRPTLLAYTRIRITSPPRPKRAGESRLAAQLCADLRRCAWAGWHDPNADGDCFAFEDLLIQPEERIGVHDALFTLQAYGPVLAIAVWDKSYKDPIYLVTNMDLVDEACYWYRKRFRIETFFSDQKTRGFHLNKSHIADPVRLSRLMISACLAYIWIIFLGALALLEGWVPIIHRTDRCDLSLFQIGLRLLDHFLNERMPIPVAFQMLELGEFV